MPKTGFSTAAHTFLQQLNNYKLQTHSTNDVNKLMHNCCKSSAGMIKFLDNVQMAIFITTKSAQYIDIPGRK